MFRLRAEAKALRFEMLVDGEAIPYVVGDEGKIRQVLINLLGNAIKFTHFGQIKLRIALRIVLTSVGRPNEIIEVRGTEPADRRRRPWPPRRVFEDACS
jgi:nitrogen-specific signal transduction histidine kinase